MNENDARKRHESEDCMESWQEDYGLQGMDMKGKGRWKKMN